MNYFKRTFGFINRHPLAKRHILRAYYAFILWQWRILFNNKLIPVQFIGPTKALAKRGLSGITGNIYTGLHEFEEMSFLLHMLRDSDTFFDVGANVGSYTLLASGVCRSKTLSFEPVPTTFEILVQNIELNGLSDKVIAINAAVGNQQETLTFTSDLGASNQVMSTLMSEQNSISVPVVNLNEYIKDAPILLKIDVEGFESEVLRGAEILLRQNSLKAIIIELNGSANRYNFDPERIHQKLISQSFRPYEYEPFSRKLTQLDHYGKLNTIYLRNLPFINDRIKSANAFKVFSCLI